MTPSRGVSGSPAQMPQLRESAASRDWRRASAAGSACGAVLSDCGAVPGWSARRAARVAPAAQADVSVTIAHLLFKYHVGAIRLTEASARPRPFSVPTHLRQHPCILGRQIKKAANFAAFSASTGQCPYQLAGLSPICLRKNASMVEYTCRWPAREEMPCLAPG